MACWHTDINIKSDPLDTVLAAIRDPHNDINECNPDDAAFINVLIFARRSEADLIAMWTVLLARPELDINGQFKEYFIPMRDALYDENRLAAAFLSVDPRIDLDNSMSRGLVFALVTRAD